MRGTGSAAVLLAVGLFAAALPCGAADWRLRLGHVIAPDTPIDLAANRFAELVTARTRGAVAVEVYADARLGAERTLIEAVQLGSLDMSFTTTGAIGGFAPEFQVLDLPYLFADYEAAYRFLDGETGRRLLATLDRRGIHGLVFLENGWRSFTSSRNPLRRPEDLEGQRIRVMESPIYMGLVSMLGARPTPMSYSELPAALESRLVDGQENPAVNVWSARMYASQPYMILDRHSYNVFIFKVNGKLWARLPEEMRLIIEDTAREVRDFQRRLNRDSEQEFLRRLRAKGMQIHEPSTDEMAAWRSVTRPLYDQARAVVGDEWVDLALRVRAEGDAPPRGAASRASGKSAARGLSERPTAPPQ